MKDGRKPIALVWDLDGTLIDSASDIAKSLNRLLVENGVEALPENRVRGMIGRGVTTLIERGFASHGHRPDAASLDKLAARFLAIYGGNGAESTRLYPGSRQVLEHFSAAGLPQAICTNKPEAITRQILIDLEIAAHFFVVVGGDTLPREKPDPLPLRRVLAALDVDPGEALMVGDSAVDVAMANAVGVPVAFVTYGYGPAPADSDDVDYFVDELAAFRRGI